MSRRGGDSTRVYNISVVGLSGTEKEKGQVGIGKSCLCNRFIRNKADDYYPEHINVLSITDFSGRIVNNDHFLYWGYTTKNYEDLPTIGFNVIEQTEFIDDATFQPFKGGKMETYTKRCTSTRIYSAEKLMYICKNQLGIEKEYEQKILPDGRLNIDGFCLLYDVSNVPGRSIENQNQQTITILNNIIKIKKPVILITTKNDEACEAYIKEIEKILNRKEYKSMNIILVETSSHDNVNIDISFILLSQLIDKIKINKIKIYNYNDMNRIRKDELDNVSESYNNLICHHINDYKIIWVGVVRELNKYPAFQRYIELFGEECAQRLYRRHIKNLKEQFILKKEKKYIEKLPSILNQLFNSLPDYLDWSEVIELIKEHQDCSLYFTIPPNNLLDNEIKTWTWGSESSTESIKENRIPLDLLTSCEAETMWRNIINQINQDKKRLDYHEKFKLLLHNTPYVTPGKSLNELQVLFMGHDCFEILTHSEIQSIYENYQQCIINKAKLNFNELLLENSYNIRIGDECSSSSEQIKYIIDVIQDDVRYKILDRLDQERRLMILKYINFIHHPNVEDCYNYPDCIEYLVENYIHQNAPKLQQNVTGDVTLTLYLIGSNTIVDCVKAALLEICDEDEYELDGVVYNVNIITQLPTTYPIHNSTHFQLKLIIYNDEPTYNEMKYNLETNLLLNLVEGEIGIEPPIIIIFYSNNTNTIDGGVGSGGSGGGVGSDLNELKTNGIELSESLNCQWIDISSSNGSGLSIQLLSETLQTLVRFNREKYTPLQKISQHIKPDIRIIMCIFCGDDININGLINPLFTLPICQQSGAKSISLLTFLGEKRKSVEIKFSSYHHAFEHRDELVHGLILIYNTNRPSSFSTLKSFSTNVPNLPIQIIALTNDEQNHFNKINTSTKMIIDGNTLADELHGHFTTLKNHELQSSTLGVYTTFFKQVYDMKLDIESAFRMDSPPLRPNPHHHHHHHHHQQQQQSKQQKKQEDIYVNITSDDDDDDDDEHVLIKNSTFFTTSNLKHKGSSGVVGKLNIENYNNISETLNRMKLNLDVIGGGRKKSRRFTGTSSRHNNDITSTSGSEPSDLDEIQLPRRKKKNNIIKKNTIGGQQSSKIKCKFTPIPTVPKGFIPYQLNSGLRARKQMVLDETEISSPTAIEDKMLKKNENKMKKKDVKLIKKLSKSKSIESSQQQQQQQQQQHITTLENATSSQGILERCIIYIEEQGLDMEGLYRVPGNRQHVDILFYKFNENNNININELDIPVNAVATALKDFLAKKLPPAIPNDRMGDIEKVSLIQDRSLRLLELKKFIHSLPYNNIKLLRLIFQHLVKVNEKSYINSMDSKNLSICWWPTILPFSFIDMFKFEQMRPYLEEIIQIFIDQYPFLFCNQDDVVMV